MIAPRRLGARGVTTTITALLLACGPSTTAKTPAPAPASSSSERPPASESAAREAAAREALRSLGAIEIGLRYAFQEETDSSGAGVGPFVHTFCPSAVEPVPTTVPKSATALGASAWSASAWTCLKFAITEPVRCQYAFHSNGEIGVQARATATVRCDPDGDGALVVATLVVAGDRSGEPRRVALTLVGARAPTEPPARSSRSSRELVAAVQAYERRICACADAACARAETDRFAVEVERYEKVKGSGGDERAIQAAIERALACRLRLEGASP